MTATGKGNHKKGSAEEASRLFRCAFTPTDFDAIDHVRQALGIRQQAVAVRYALDQQLLWAQANGTPYRPIEDDRRARAAERKLIDRRLDDFSEKLAAKVRDSVMAASSDRRQWSFFTTGRQREAIESLKAAWGMESLVETIRLAVRLQAAATGFKPKGGWDYIPSASTS